MTWRDYFTKVKLAREAEREASTEFQKAGERLTARSDAVATLDEWARAADKVKPYTGGSMENEEVEL